jgi:type II secretory pathway pseudopilin PulG
MNKKTISGNLLHTNKKAFSLLELMISCAILMFIVIGLLYSYIACFELNEFNRSLTLASNALQAQIEQLRETDFDSLQLLDGTNFSLSGFSSGDAIGLRDIYATTYSDLTYVRLVACWRQKSGRVIGEDTNLDGTLQSSEDKDLDNIMDSPAEIVTFISRVE